MRAHSVMLARTAMRGCSTAARAPGVASRAFSTSKVHFATDNQQKQWLDQAIQQLKHCAAVEQTPPGQKPPPAPKIENPIKDMFMKEVKALRKELEDNYAKTFELTEEQYQKGLANFNAEKNRLGLKDADMLQPPGRKTSWKQILEG